MNELPYAFADAIEAIITDRNGVNALLLDLLASLVHPDMVCNLFVLKTMNEREQSIARRCIDYAFSVGLSSEESAAIYRFIRPHVAARFCQPA